VAERRCLEKECRLVWLWSSAMEVGVAAEVQVPANTSRRPLGVCSGRERPLGGSADRLQLCRRLESGGAVHRRRHGRLPRFSVPLSLPRDQQTPDLAVCFRFRLPRSPPQFLRKSRLDRTAFSSPQSFSERTGRNSTGACWSAGSEFTRGVGEGEDGKEEKSRSSHGTEGSRSLGQLILHGQ
jgi:hypothetical protein